MKVNKKKKGGVLIFSKAISHKIISVSAGKIVLDIDRPYHVRRSRSNVNEGSVDCANTKVGETLASVRGSQ